MSSVQKKSRSWLICLLLACVSALAFWPVHHHSFVNFDDDVFIADNPHVAGGLTAENVRWAFSRQPEFYWRPLTWMSMMLDCQLFGLNAGGHHLTSLLLHIASTILLFLVLRRMTGAPWPSAFVAALFAWHPLHVESVAWAADRVDVLSGFFWVLALGAYVIYVERRRDRAGQTTLPNAQPRLLPALLPLTLSLVLFACALMAKPTVVTFPFLLLLLDYWPLKRVTRDGWRVANDASKVQHENSSSSPHEARMGRGSRRGASSPQPSPPFPNGGEGVWHWGALVLEKIPFFLLTLAASLFALKAQEEGGATRNLLLPFAARLENALVSYLRYVGKFLFPQGLATPYPHPMSWPLWQVVGAVLVLVTISVLVVRGRRERPWLFVGWFWFVGTLVPTIGLIQVGFQALADRYTYLPLIGLFIMLAWTGAELVGAKAQRSALVAMGAGAILLGCVVMTSLQLSYWNDTERLFRHAIAVTKNNFIANNNLGFYLAKHDQFDEAVQLCQNALAIKPDYADARNNLAFAYSRQHRLDDAIAQYELALQLRPNDAQTLNNLGSAYADKQMWEQAVTRLAKAVELDPQNADAHYNLGLTLAKMGKRDEAIQHYREAVRIRPSFTAAHSNLGNALLSQGKIAEAREEYQVTLKFKPEDVAAWNNLGSTYSRENKLDDAIAAYRQALHFNPASMQAHYNVAIALSRAGRRQEAVAELQEVLRLQPDFAPAKEQLNALTASTNRQ